LNFFSLKKHEIYVERKIGQSHESNLITLSSGDLNQINVVISSVVQIKRRHSHGISIISGYFASDNMDLPLNFYFLGIKKFLKSQQIKKKYPSKTLKYDDIFSS
jgi:hypothetical protein